MATNAVNNILQSIIDRLPYIVAGILVMLIFFGLSKLIKRLFWFATKHTHLDARMRILFGRMLVILFFVIGVFASLTVIIPSFTLGDLIAGLGFTSFVIAFATKDIMNNLLSGVLILWQQPFKIGDQIFIGNNQGKVEYIGVRATSLRKDDGEIVLIPNGDMYSGAMTIRGAGAKRRMNLNFSIGYNSDINAAKEIIRETLQNIGKIVEDPAAKIVATDLALEGVRIAIYYWINTNENSPLDVVDLTVTAIKEALMAEGIEIYPPTAVIVQQAAGNTSAEPKKSASAK